MPKRSLPKLGGEPTPSSSSSSSSSLALAMEAGEGKRKRKPAFGQPEAKQTSEMAEQPVKEDDFLVDVEQVEEQQLEEDGKLEKKKPAAEEEEQKQLISSELADIPGRSRREKEKNAFLALADLLPLSPPIRDQLDKTGVLRVSIAFLQLHRLISALMGDGKGEEPARLGEERTTAENQEARQRQRKWALEQRKPATTVSTGFQQEQQKTTATLQQFAFNLFQAMDGFAIVLNHQGQVVYVSETVAVHLGLSQIELVGNGLSDFVHPQDVPLLRDKLALFVDCGQLRVLGPELRFMLRFRCSPGRRPMLCSSVTAGLRQIGGMPAFKTIHFVGTLWPDNVGRFIGFGQPLVVYGQHELRMSPSMFMFRATLSLELIFVDTRFTAFSAFPAPSLLDHRLYEFVHPEDVEQLAEMHQSALDQGQSQGGPFRLLASGGGGGHFWVHCRLCLVHSNRIACASVAQMLIGVCSLISGVERNGKNSQIETKCEGGEEEGTLGYYSSKFYGSGHQQTTPDGDG